MPSAPGPSGPKPPLSTDRPSLGVPLFILNLKAYPQRLGPGASLLGQAFEEKLHAAKVSGAIAPAAADLGVLAGALSIPVIAQHADAQGAGARTGYLVPEAIRAAGGRGSLVNHSEHPLPLAVIGTTLHRLRSLGLVAVLCARGVADARRLAAFRPPYLAVEPPELIGGTRSVSAARPTVVSRSVQAVHAISPETHVLCGAGIHTRYDVWKALALGAEGILVASAVARAEDPSAAIDELLAGFRVPDAAPG